MPRELLVQFDSHTTPERRDAILDEVGGEVISILDLVPGLVHARIHMDLTRAIRLLKTRREVLRVERNYRLYPAAGDPPIDSDFSRQWGLHIHGEYIIPVISTDDGIAFPLIFADIDAPPAWDLHTGDGEFVVAILDTGLMGLADPPLDWFVDTRHEFKGNLWIENASVGWDFVKMAPGVTVDTTGHGTAVAGIIGARAGTTAADDIVGVNWSCKLMPLRFIGSSVDANQSLGVSGNVALAISALNYAVSRNVKLSNNSYGAYGLNAGDLTLFKMAIAAAGVKGHLFIAAAGNGNNSLDATPYYPASFGLANMVVVTSSDERAEKASHGNHSPTIVDIAAPGVAIFSCHKYSYARDDGTSYASAYVTGAAALVWSLHPEWTLTKVKASLLSSASRHAELEPFVDSGRLLSLHNLIAGNPGLKNPDPHPTLGSHNFGTLPENW